jgi:hypothetical protein
MPQFKRVVKFPDIRDWPDKLLVEIRDKPWTEEDYKDLLTKVTLLSALRDQGLARQGIHVEVPEAFKEENISATGLKVAAYLAERFKDLLSVPAKAWQQRVRMYERYSAGQLDMIRQDFTETINTLKHTEALQEVNRALAYLQLNYPVPHDAQVREGELSGFANPDQTISVVQPDDNMQCPQGTMWSARVGGCVAIQDGTASTGFDTSKGGNLASSDLRKARSGTGRPQFIPEGTDVRLDQGNSNRWHHDNDYTPNRAMGNPSGCEVSDLNITTQQMPSGDRLPKGLSSDMLNRQREALREGELSGMGNPDKEIEVIPADANGQCRPGWIYSARVGGCIRIEDGTANTGFDTTAGGNTAASDLRKSRALTARRQFIPEGTKVVLGNDRYLQNDDGIPNRAMGNPTGCEHSDVGITTQTMPGGDKLPTGLSPDMLNRVREGELSGMANPDQILQGVPPDEKGQCRRGHMFSAMVGMCIPLSVDQQADALSRNRTQHTPEGTVTRLGRTYGHDNSDQPNPAMGFQGSLAMLQDEGWISLSKHYACCMFMLREARRYSYYASKHASERFCFLPFEGQNDGYINGRNELAHASPLNLTEKVERTLDEWRKAEDKDFNEKTKLDSDYQEQLQQRLSYRPTLTYFVTHRCIDETIQHLLETRTDLPPKTIHELMRDVRIIRSTLQPPPPKPKVKLAFGESR